ncbi:MAG TPA: gephyrin-like molybdotransferase Glp [Candidatus Saccharimonadales bacterium]|jgi:molybdopterin molybdotransferase|nr:gephyrin-like molybdotransferase Glp [Candidatus Saccharimonadales bacterium]
MIATTYDNALSTVLSTVQPLPAECISLENALGRIAAEKVFAGEDAVPYPRSAMDGFAVRACDCALATRMNPIELPVAGQVFAEKGESVLTPGTALTIMTGAPIPRGADAVIPQERAERSETNVRIFAPVAPGDCVFPPGEDFRHGDELIATGDVLNPGKLALLAFAGKPLVRVFRRPRVAIVCTGNELVDVEDMPARGQVRNSNAVALSALVRAAGGESRYEGVARDNYADLAAMLQRAQSGADLILTTGGASKGERDLVKSTLTGLGCEFHFTHVAMRPGRPFGFAEWGWIPVCVLPGNPAAAFVCFHKLVGPALARLSGRRSCELPKLRARLATDLHARAGRPYFVLAYVQRESEGFVVKPIANQCSALVRTAADANAIITVQEKSGESSTVLRQDEIIEVEVIDWSSVFDSLPSIQGISTNSAHVSFPRDEALANLGTPIS